MKNYQKYIPLLLNFSFLSLLTGHMVSSFGDRLNYMALTDLVTKYRPGSAFELSKMLLFIMLPSLIFAPLAGVYVDRWNRKKIMIISDIVRALLVLLLPLIIALFYSIDLVYAVVFLLYATGIFFNLPREAIIPDLINKERLLGANSLLYLVGAISAVAGTSLGGIFVGLTNWEIGFYANSATYFLAAIAISLMVWKPKMDKEQSGNCKSSVENSVNNNRDKIFVGELKYICRKIVEGLYLVKDNPLVLFAIGSASLIITVGGVMFAVGIAFLKRAIQVTTADLGIFAGLAGVGVMVGMALLNKFGRSYSRKYLILISFFMLGMLIIGFSNVSSRINISILMFISGVIIAPLIVVPDTLLQEILPNDIRGRVFSFKEVCMRIVFIIATMSLGLIADLWNKKFLLMGIGGTLCIISLLGACLFRNLSATAVEIRTIDRDSAE